MNWDDTPEEATFRSRRLRGDLDAAWVEALARRVAAFHAGAEAVRFLRRRS